MVGGGNSLFLAIGPKTSLICFGQSVVVMLVTSPWQPIEWFWLSQSVELELLANNSTGSGAGLITGTLMQPPGCGPSQAFLYKVYWILPTPVKRNTGQSCFSIGRIQPERRPKWLSAGKTRIFRP